MTIRGRVLVIAGSDSGGGAGIQADIKTLSAMGAYAATAITAVTVQNTLGVTGIHIVPPEIVAAQIAAVLSDIGADCIKIGMLGDRATIEAVTQALAPWPAIPLVLDPVMIAKGGASLLTPDSISALKALLPRAALVTPNIPEAETLTGRRIETLDDMAEAGELLRQMGAEAVYLKGGHLPGETVTDMLIRATDETVYAPSPIDTPHTHGTGCTLASALAAGIAQNMPLPDAAARAHSYVHAAIKSAPGLGGGHGPLNHFVD
jgi:hydroxymethylpyrimidine/phosphomethylpyrimidine kinase